MAEPAWPRHGVIAAVQRHDTSILFDWLVNGFAYSGVSDRIAEQYMAQHGRMRWRDIADAMAESPTCPKLRCYWSFEDCGYRKGAGSCANPDHQPNCPLPRHDLRNGRLNQSAYALFLFMRDVAGGDFVGWINSRLAMVDPAPASDRPARLRQALLEPLENIYGVTRSVSVDVTLGALLEGRGLGRLDLPSHTRRAPRLNGIATLYSR